MFILTVAMY